MSWWVEIGGREGATESIGGCLGSRGRKDPFLSLRAFVQRRMLVA